MTLFKSPHPRLEIPTDLTTWEWAFEHPAWSPVASYPPSSPLSSLPLPPPPSTTSSSSPPPPPLPRHPSPGAYIDASSPRDRRLDYAEVKRLAALLHTALARPHRRRRRRLLLLPGETVSVFAANSPWYPVAVWAAQRAGARVSGASPAYGVEETAHALRAARSRLVLVLPGPPLAVAREAARRVGLPPERVLLLERSGEGEGEGDDDGAVSMQDLIAEVERDIATAAARGDNADGEPPGLEPAWRLPPGTSNREVCGYLTFSSGTTGLPKAVMLSHHNVIAQCLQLRQMQVLPSSRRYRVVAAMPLFHITGLVRFVTYPVLLDGDCVMLPRYSLAALVGAVRAWEVEELILVPPIIRQLAVTADLGGGAGEGDGAGAEAEADLRRLVRRFSSGSAPMSPDVLRRLAARFPGAGFRQGYGATESTACISQHPPSHFDFRYAHTGGKLVANTEAKILSLDPHHHDAEARRLLGPGETGEICARGPQIAMGYLGDAAATAASFDPDGFLHTGDVGHIDAEGLLHIEDRIKEMIKVKGQQVAPAELEAALLGHEGVEDCAVLAVPDPRAGERPKAYVVPRRRRTPGPPPADPARLGRDLLELVQERFVRYKWLVEVEYIDALPRNPTGKLLRRKLKERETLPDTDRGLRVRSSVIEPSRL